MKDYAELEKRLREQMAARVRDVWSKNERERYDNPNDVEHRFAACCGRFLADEHVGSSTEDGEKT